ncbi:MAG: hypothetical protein AAB681_01305 [Patescibacteria group bacterium]
MLFVSAIVLFIETQDLKDYFWQAKVWVGYWLVFVLLERITVYLYRKPKEKYLNYDSLPGRPDMAPPYYGEEMETV